MGYGIGGSEYYCYMAGFSAWRLSVAFYINDTHYSGYRRSDSLR
jgi:hypothetical protein